ncbi:MAG: Riboflavin biosynthesis protein RibF [Alphaproteobacteria bacterium ADurb.Bin438]|nr:MAG: Riboflavin biosynthesis protein RibF [Alphaproteobacteria bacterium ADurb.Bin438]
MNGFSYFGKRPTLSNIEPVLENHIFDKDFDLYNKRIRIQFIKHIRDEIKFNSIDEIKSQLMQDMVRAKEILL